MADSVLRDKSKAFAKEIVFLCRRLAEARDRLLPKLMNGEIEV